MIRWLKLRSLILSRQYRGDRTLLGRLLASEMVHWNRRSASRGMAVGMFWAFTPIPLQMLPASLFCWLVGGNLPLAMLCVWLSNPVTIPPIIYLEYRIGQLILSAFTTVDGTIADQSGFYASFTGGLRYVLTGSMFLSCAMMIVGYVTIQVAFELSKRNMGRPRGGPG